MADFYATPAGAGDKDGSDWDNAFDIGAFGTYFVASATAGDNYYFLSGTYTFSANISSSKVGAINNYINIIGVSDTSLTPATGTDRPYFDEGGYYLTIHRKNTISNIIISSSYPYAIGLYQSIAYNCKFTGTGIRTIYSPYSGAVVDTCEVYNTHASGGAIVAFLPEVRYSYIKATNYGIQQSTTCSNIIHSNIFDSCAVAIAIQNDIYFLRIAKNTIYNCPLAITFDYITTTGEYGIYDNIFHTVTSIITHNIASPAPVSFEIYNNVFYNYTNLFSGTGMVFPTRNTLTADPKLVSPATGDFTLASDSPYLNSGLQNPFGRP